jgi:hypothetical protein
LSAPFKSIKGNPAVIAPEIVLAAPPLGDIVIDVQGPAPKIAPPTASVVLPVMEMEITPVAVVPKAVKALPRVAYEPLPVPLPPVEVTVTCPQTPPLNSSSNTTRKLKFLNTLILLDSEENRKSVVFFIIVCFGNIYYRMFKKDMIYEIKKK